MNMQRVNSWAIFPAAVAVLALPSAAPSAAGAPTSVADRTEAIGRAALPAINDDFARASATIDLAQGLISAGRCPSALPLLKSVAGVFVKGREELEVARAAIRWNDTACLLGLADVLQNPGIDPADDQMNSAPGAKHLAGALLVRAGKEAEGRKLIAAAEAMLNAPSPIDAQVLAKLRPDIAARIASRAHSKLNLWRARVAELAVYEDSPLYRPALQRYAADALVDPASAATPFDDLVRGLLAVGDIGLAEQLSQAAPKAGVYNWRSIAERRVDDLTMQGRTAEVLAALGSLDVEGRRSRLSSISASRPEVLLPHVGRFDAWMDGDLAASAGALADLAIGLARKKRIADAQRVAGEMVKRVQAAGVEAVAAEEFRAQAVAFAAAQFGHMDLGCQLAQVARRHAYASGADHGLARGAAAAGRWSDVDKVLATMAGEFGRHSFYNSLIYSVQSAPADVRRQAVEHLLARAATLRPEDSDLLLWSAVGNLAQNNEPADLIRKVVARITSQVVRAAALTQAAAEAEIYGHPGLTAQLVDEAANAVVHANGARGNATRIVAMLMRLGRTEQALAFTGSLGNAETRAAAAAEALRCSKHGSLQSVVLPTGKQGPA